MILAEDILRYVESGWYHVGLFPFVPADSNLFAWGGGFSFI